MQSDRPLIVTGQGDYRRDYTPSRGDLLPLLASFLPLLLAVGVLMLGAFLSGCVHRSEPDWRRLYVESQAENQRLAERFGSVEAGNMEEQR